MAKFKVDFIAVGTFNAGGTVEVEASNIDEARYFALEDIDLEDYIFDIDVDDITQEVTPSDEAD